MLEAWRERICGWWMMGDGLLEMRGIVCTRTGRRGGVVGSLWECLSGVGGGGGGCVVRRVLFGAWFVTRCFTGCWLVMVGGGWTGVEWREGRGLSGLGAESGALAIYGRYILLWPWSCYRFVSGCLNIASVYSHTDRNISF